MIYKDRKPIPIEKKAKRAVGQSFLPEDIDITILKTLPYEYPAQKINVELNTTEFTCLCPFSGLPDFACLIVTYVPRNKLVELKSLKYYLYAFRNVKVYNEHAVNKILIDLKKVLTPRQITVEGEFTVRGGVKSKVSAQYKAGR